MGLFIVRVSLPYYESGSVPYGGATATHVRAPVEMDSLILSTRAAVGPGAFVLLLMGGVKVVLASCVDDVWVYCTRLDFFGDLTVLV